VDIYPSLTRDPLGLISWTFLKSVAECGGRQTTIADIGIELSRLKNTTRLVETFRETTTSNRSCLILFFLTFCHPVKSSWKAGSSRNHAVD
jgi:hypothetical protein